MATRSDIAKQQEKLKVKHELLTAKIKKMEATEKVKEMAKRLRNMGGR